MENKDLAKQIVKICGSFDNEYDLYDEVLNLLNQSSENKKSNKKKKSKDEDFFWKENVRGGLSLDDEKMFSSEQYKKIRKGLSKIKIINKK